MIAEGSHYFLQSSVFMNSNLRNSVENLYRTFSKYSLKAQIDGCPCCIGKEKKRQLHSKPLGKLSGEDLSLYGFKAMTTFGGLEDFKHFLPRLFEITLDGDFELDTAIIFGKLKYANWQKWDKTETSAIKNFFVELFRSAVDFDADNSYRTEEFLVGIACAVEDIRPYLDLWLEGVSENRIATLKFFVVDCNYGMSDAFLADQPEKRRQIQQWLVSDEVTLILENLWQVKPDSQLTEDLTATLEIIYQIRNETTTFGRLL